MAAGHWMLSFWEERPATGSTWGDAWGYSQKKQVRPQPLWSEFSLELSLAPRLIDKIMKSSHSSESQWNSLHHVWNVWTLPRFNMPRHALVPWPSCSFCCRESRIISVDFLLKSIWIWLFDYILLSFLNPGALKTWLKLIILQVGEAAVSRWPQSQLMSTVTHDLPRIFVLLLESPRNFSFSESCHHPHTPFRSGEHCNGCSGM